LEGGLEQAELFEGTAGDPTVGGVLDLAVLAEGGAEEADGAGAMALDFEVERRRIGFHGYNITQYYRCVKHNMNICMATFEMQNRGK
jgi:hypothetical protein